MAPQFFIAVGFSAAAFLFAFGLVAYGFIRALREVGPAYAYVAAGHGDVLPERVGKPPRLKTGQGLAESNHSPDDRFSEFTGSIDQFYRDGGMDRG